mgnify:CR=1 FL=1
MTDTTSLEEDSVVEVLVGGVAIAYAFACVKEEGDGEILAA